MLLSKHDTICFVSALPGRVCLRSICSHSPAGNGTRLIPIFRRQRRRFDSYSPLSYTPSLVCSASHCSDRSATSHSETRIFPEKDEGGRATCVALVNSHMGGLLVFGTSSGGGRAGGGEAKEQLGGTVEYFSLTDWAVLSGCELKHTVGIKNIYPNANGTRAVVVDETGAGLLFNPVNGDLLEIPAFGESNDVPSAVLWDSADYGVFTSVHSQQFHTYIYAPVTINGAQITKLGSLRIEDNGQIVTEPSATEIPHGASPVLVFNGTVTCQLQNGTLTTITLETHRDLAPVGQASERLSFDDARRTFAPKLALSRLKEAWEAALIIRSDACWFALGGKAMEQMDIDMAVRVYREMGDAGMVMALEKIEDIQDKNLLAGHIQMLFSDCTQAQEMFLASTRPVTALEMRRDLLHWDHALKLADTLAPEEVPSISIEYAQQLEFTGDYSSALQMYESALGGLDQQQQLWQVEGKHAGGSAAARPSEEALGLQRKQCHGGIARMLLRQGDLRRGVAMAQNSGDKQLCRDCGAILAGLRQYSDAAGLYELGEQYDKAVDIYIQSKNFMAASPLMDKIKIPKLHQQFAKAKESVGDFAQAGKQMPQVYLNESEYSVTCSVYIVGFLTQPSHVPSLRVLSSLLLWITNVALTSPTMCIFTMLRYTHHYMPALCAVMNSQIIRKCAGHGQRCAAVPRAPQQPGAGLRDCPADGLVGRRANGCVVLPATEQLGGCYRIPFDGQAGRGMLYSVPYSWCSGWGPMHVVRVSLGHRLCTM